MGVFVRQLGTALLIAMAAGFVVAILLAPVAPLIRSEASMRTTPFATFEPEGALLVNDGYFGRIGRTTTRAQIWREYVTDDGSAFQRAFIDLARFAGAEVVYAQSSASPTPLSRLRAWDEHLGYTFGAYAHGTLATITFSDRGPFQAAGRSWRLRVAMTIRDGPCHIYGTPCMPAPD